MKNLLQRYTVSTFIILFLIGYIGHETHGQGAEPVGQSAIISYDPLVGTSIVTIPILPSGLLGILLFPLNL